MKVCVISQGTTPELSVSAEHVTEVEALADFATRLPAASLVLCDIRVGTIIFDKAALKKFAAISTLPAWATLAASDEEPPVEAAA